MKQLLINLTILAGMMVQVGFGLDNRLDFRSSMEPGKQSDGTFLAWVYFLDKPQAFAARTITPTAKAMDRRQQRASRDLSWYDRNLSKEYVERIKSTGVIIRNQSRWLNAVSIRADEEVLEEIRRFPCVKRIEPVMTYHRLLPESRTILSPLLSRIMDGDTLDYGYAQAQIEQINMDLVHEAGYYGQNVRVLVLDTGFNLEHPAFDSLQVIAQWDFVQDDSVTSNQDGDYGSQHNHGTYIMGAIAGYKPGELIGPAFQAEFLLGKTEIVDQEIQLEEDNYVAGLEWGEAMGADVVSSSLGYLDWYEYSDLDGNTAVTTNAVDIAVAHGLVCVTAAGNEGSTGWTYIIAPADADSVISVGAVSESGTIAYFSSHGPTYDGRIKPEVCARGLQTATVSPTGDAYLYVNGTSLSTPLVGGTAAAILSAHPEWTPMQVREAFMMTASQASHPDTLYGWGILNAYAALNYADFQNSEDPEVIPNKYQLFPAYPNPFNNGTTIHIAIPETGLVLVAVYDILGNKVATILDRELEPQHVYLNWDDPSLASGIYLVHFQYPGGTETRKITYLK